MSLDVISALVVFAFVTSITPGPNNLMLMASGANFGWSRTVPHMLGIGIGFVVMIFLVGLGLMGLFERAPVLHDVLKLVSIGYLCWLAWKIATAATPSGVGDDAKPMTFLQAAAFQWANPKAWAMALTAITAYAPERNLTGIAIVALVFGTINLPCVSSWALIGREIRRFLGTPARLRAFNWTMAALLILSMLPLLI